MKKELEYYIDRTNLTTVLYEITGIAKEKAKHIDETWQDEALAGDWEEAAIRIEKCAQAIEDKYGL